MLGMRGSALQEGLQKWETKKRPTPPLKEASSERKQRTSAMPEKNVSINLAGSPVLCDSIRETAV